MRHLAGKIEVSIPAYKHGSPRAGTDGHSSYTLGGIETMGNLNCQSIKFCNQLCEDTHFERDQESS